MQDNSQATLAAAAAANATAAATSAANTATSIALLGNDLGWIRDKVKSIDTRLAEIGGVFATRSETAEMSKIQVDHENRIRQNTADIGTLKTQLKTGGVAFGVAVTVVQIVLHFWK